MNPSLKYGVWLGFCALGLASCGGGSSACPTGSESCACYGNGTCDADLECNAQLECVVGSPSSGGTPGTGGSPAATGGTVSGSGGSVVTTGGTSSASGGDTASGGSTSCGDTSSDWENCGECGRVCEGVCEDGQCAALVGCFEEDAGFTTCDEYCPSIGETCTEQCGVAATAWNQIDLSWCENDEDPYSYVSKCDDPLPYSDNNAIYRCCCTDS